MMDGMLQREQRTKATEHFLRGGTLTFHFTALESGEEIDGVPILRDPKIVGVEPTEIPSNRADNDLLSDDIIRIRRFFAWRPVTGRNHRIGYYQTRWLRRVVVVEERWATPQRGTVRWFAKDLDHAFKIADVRRSLRLRPGDAPDKPHRSSVMPPAT